MRALHMSQAFKSEDSGAKPAKHCIHCIHCIWVIVIHRHLRFVCQATVLEIVGIFGKGLLFQLEPL